jgi:hypothetical protein
VAVVVWLLDLQPHMQSVSFNTDVVRSNLNQSEVCNNRYSMRIRVIQVLAKCKEFLFLYNCILLNCNVENVREYRAGMEYFVTNGHDCIPAYNNLSKYLNNIE